MAFRLLAILSILLPLAEQGRAAAAQTRRLLRSAAEVAVLEQNDTVYGELTTIATSMEAVSVRKEFSDYIKNDAVPRLVRLGSSLLGFSWAFSSALASA